MLLHLHVKNLALIREAEIDFTEGLNILTGETGAGKSILIGSMTMALGGKVSREMLREDAGYALAELIFDADSPRLLERLEELDIPAGDGEVILARRISGGRSVCRVNGETVSSAALKEIASYLIDIHGQHEHQSLLNKKKHLEILDAYAHEKLGPLLLELSESFCVCRGIKKELEELSGDDSARMREQSLLEFELKEIGEAALTEGEDAELEQNYRRMVNSQRILEALSAARQCCDEDEASASDQIGRACREILSVVRYDEGLDSLAAQIQEIDGMLADFTRELSDHMENLEFSEQDFRDTERRLDEINRLKAKYGPTIADILACRKDKQKRLDILANYEQYRKKLESDYEKARKELEELCAAAHAVRAEASEELAERMRGQLAELNFLDVRFEIAVRRAENISENGYDDVEFLISTNPGEPLKALGKIASGGELSRVMLAIKTVMADQDEIGTVIFDEIDAGISGRTAQRVSEKLALIARSRQVICITHLAQIASMADSHFCIEKRAVDGSTVTDIRRLAGAETAEELARILGGSQITEAVRENAREMMRLAREYKEGL